MLERWPQLPSILHPAAAEEPFTFLYPASWVRRKNSNRDGLAISDYGVRAGPCTARRQVWLQPAVQSMQGRCTLRRGTLIGAALRVCCGLTQPGTASAPVQTADKLSLEIFPEPAGSSSASDLAAAAVQVRTWLPGGWAGYLGALAGLDGAMLQSGGRGDASQQAPLPQHPTERSSTPPQKLMFPASQIGGDARLELPPASRIKAEQREIDGKVGPKCIGGSADVSWGDE